MRLMLINTPIDSPSILGGFRRIYDDLKMIPTGLAYLAASARKRGIDVRILDQYAECLALQEIEERIRSYSPDLLGYGATTPNYPSTMAMVRSIKEKFPSIRVVLGGNHPTIFPDEALRSTDVDYVLRGEAEVSLPELCLALERGDRQLDAIRGLSYRDAGGAVTHNPNAPAVDLDSLPWPAYDLLPMQLYSTVMSARFARPVYQMLASRGCPNRCSYCINAVEPKLGATYRRRGLDDVVDEMEMLVSTYGARQIQFWDPIFPLGKTHCLAFCNKVMERGLHKRIVWNSTTYAHLLDEEMITTMAKAGCRGLGFGIESGVPALLRSVNKRADLEKARTICRVATRHGITVGVGFIFGFPGETQEMTRQTLDYAKSLDVHYAQFSLLVPYPGTPLYRQLRDSGDLPAIPESEFHRINQSVGLTDNDMIYVPKGRSSDELKAWQKRAYREFYLRPKMVWMHLRHLRPDTLGQMLNSFVAVCRLSASRPARPAIP